MWSKVFKSTFHLSTITHTHTCTHTYVQLLFYRHPLQWWNTGGNVFTTRYQIHHIQIRKSFIGWSNQFYRTAVRAQNLKIKHSVKQQTKHIINLKWYRKTDKQFKFLIIPKQTQTITQTLDTVITYAYYIWHGLVCIPLLFEYIPHAQVCPAPPPPHHHHHHHTHFVTTDLVATVSCAELDKPWYSRQYQPSFFSWPWW